MQFIVCVGVDSLWSGVGRSGQLARDWSVFQYRVAGSECRRLVAW